MTKRKIQPGSYCSTAQRKVTNKMEGIKVHVNIMYAEIPSEVIDAFGNSAFGDDYYKLVFDIDEKGIVTVRKEW